MNVAATLVGPEAHSPYLVARLADERPNLYGVAKFAAVADELRRIASRLGRPPRVLDLGCSTKISLIYLAREDVSFEYCGVDYEAAFSPDIVMDVRELDARVSELPWIPDVIMFLDVLEHLPGREADIHAAIGAAVRTLPEHGEILIVAPQLYRLDRLKLSWLHYPEHMVRFTMDEWVGIAKRSAAVVSLRGVGYICCLPYLVMLHPGYRDDNRLGKFFYWLRGNVFEWAPLKAADIRLGRWIGRCLPGWANATLIVLKKADVDDHGADE